MRLSTAFKVQDSSSSSLTAVQFDDQQNLLLGRSNGALEVYDKKNRQTQHFRHSRGSVTQIRVRGSYMATSDEDKCVALYYFENNTYTYLGKYRSHRAEITGLCFVSDTDLISVSRDGFKVTYDLDKTSIRNGVVLKSRERCERTGTQTTSSCCDIKNNTLITSSTDQKFVNWSYDGSSYECTLLYVTSNHSATHPFTTFLKSLRYYSWTTRRCCNKIKHRKWTKSFGIRV
jgi:WD40 repeat protein